MDCLHLPDAYWRGDHNLCNPPWELVDDLAAKLRSSGAEATFIAPYWPKKPWFMHKAELSNETVDMPPKRDLFSPQKNLGQGGSGLPPRASWPSDYHSAMDAAEERPPTSGAHLPTLLGHLLREGARAP